jgi:PBP1b-binding outer membrane lipoprotein LpoB
MCRNPRGHVDNAHSTRQDSRMKSILLSSLFAMLLFSACSENSQVTEPASAPDAANSFAVELNRLDLSLEQSALIDEMHFMDEDLSILLDPVRLDAFDSMLDGRTDRKAGIDIAAIIYYQLIIKANPDLDEDIIKQLRELIAASNQLRARILNSGKSREEIAALLKAEHDKLMRAINALIGAEAVANVEKLKARLEEERKERRDEWQTARVDRLVQLMTKTLELSEGEAAAVKRILMLQYEEIARLREQFKDNPEGFREALRALQARIDAMMGEAIGPKWERWKELQQKRITPGDQVPNVDMQVKKLTELLRLSERQAAAVKDILLQQQLQMRALIQKYGTDRAGLAEALKQLQLRVDTQIAALLTPEQLEIWKKFKSNTGGTGTRDRG